MAPSPTPNPVKTTPFSHEGKAVFVLMPASLLDSRACTTFITELTEGTGVKPELSSALPIVGLPLDSVLYVAHPVAKTVKAANGRVRTTNSVHISPPIDVAKEAVNIGRNNYRTVDSDSLTRAVSKSCKNDPAGRFFRGVVTGEGHKDPSAVVLRLTDM